MTNPSNLWQQVALIFIPLRLTSTLIFQMYIDPKNPRHAQEEAETLVALSDIDHDGQLSLSEVLSKMDLFLGSKMVDTAKSFHDEF